MAGVDFRPAGLALSAVWDAGWALPASGDPWDPLAAAGEALPVLVAPDVRRDAEVDGFAAGFWGDSAWGFGAESVALDWPGLPDLSVRRDRLVDVEPVFLAPVEPAAVRRREGLAVASAGSSLAAAEAVVRPRAGLAVAPLEVRVDLVRFVRLPEAAPVGPAPSSLAAERRRVRDEDEADEAGVLAGFLRRRVR